MTNIEFKVDDDKILHIKVDLKQEHGKSNSGKSTIIATTSGNVAIGDGMAMGLNVYKK